MLVLFCNQYVADVTLELYCLLGTIYQVSWCATNEALYDPIGMLQLAKTH